MRPELINATPTPRNAAVLAVLRAYPNQSLTCAQIADRVEYGTSTVAGALQRLAYNGDVRRIDGKTPRWVAV